MRILGLFIELGTDGGVQRLGRHMALALSRYCRLHGDGMEIASFADPLSINQMDVQGERIPLRPFARNRAAFTRFLLTRRADVIYSNHFLLVPPLRLRKLLQPRLRYGVHMHGVDGWLPTTFIRRAGLKGATIITSTSRHTAEETIRQHGVLRERVVVLHPAMDPDASQIAPEPAAPPARPHLLTVARLARTESQKQIDLAIRAFARIADRFPDWDFLIVGDGDDAPRLRDIARQTCPGDRIRFLGRVSDEELARLYRQSALFVLPSLKEGLGIVFIEALWQGIPCIGARSGGIPEVIRDGETGLLLDENSPEALSRLLQRLMEDPAGRRAMGERARADMRSRFSFETFERRFHAVLDVLTARQDRVASGDSDH